MTADRAAADTLRDELAEGLKEAWDNVTGITYTLRHWENVLAQPTARAALDRYADAQVAAERERIAFAILREPYADNSADAFRRCYAIARGQP